ncbi:hypothetical protein OG320_05280 [Microbispora sp. NBC_01189]|uniref:ComF family protein n=1 Tax=Microbispora sp. NBC_01189 TaxID=2903583 RepID=UPI002E122514|nr:hypothetical protein OG320_05280 [Microbispora sp. NBC_01189]
MAGTPHPADRPEPNGFGNCRGCPYVTVGPIATCYDCASARMKPPDDASCPICHQSLPSPGAECVNRLCNSPQRAFESTAVIGVKAGVLERTIWELKQGVRGWGVIHARIVLGFLYDHPELVDAVDAIIPTPGMWTEHNGQRRRDHVGWVIQQAREQDDQGLPFVLTPPLIKKTQTTRKMRGSNMWERDAVGSELRAALRVPDPDRVEGLRIMVYDDVFTTGNTLNAVAWKLKEAGARKVYGLTLARQPWSSR